jgi:hypothetical protein
MWAVVLCLCFTVPCFSESIHEAADNYFAFLKKDFDRLALNPALRNPRINPVNRIFVTSLKKHQPLAYLARVNARGLVINEVVRGEVPQKKVKRKVGDVEWYSAVAKNKRTYCGFAEDNGRYYLIWSEPIVAKKRFGGVIAAKVDIWDCFHKLSNETMEPFLVRIGQKSLYSNKWKNESAFVEEPLAVPGVETISLLTERPSPAAHVAETLAASVRRDTSSVAPGPAPVSALQPGAAATTGAKKASSGFAKHRTVIIIIGIVIAIIFIFLLFQFYVWLNHKFLMRSINRPD